jgi:hypothetical protein
MDARGSSSLRFVSMWRLAVASVLAAIVVGAAAAQTEGPPPAFVDSSRGETQLGFGSNCWSFAGGARCVDYVPPDYRCDLPYVVAAQGDILRFRLGFDPTEVVVSVGEVSAELPPAREFAWQVDQFAAGALLGVFARGAAGDASYLARLTTTPPRRAAAVELRPVRGAHATWLRGAARPRAGSSGRIVVELLARPLERTRFARATTFRTDARGRFSIRVAPRVRTAYRVRWRCATSRTVVVAPSRPR